MSTPNNAPSYTLESCRQILDETIGLLEVTKQSVPNLDRLNLLLSKHFANNEFRSHCCFGHSNADVSLELFNSLCVLPSTDWTVHLVASDHSPILQPSHADVSSAQLAYDQKFKLISTNISTLLVNIANLHPLKDQIRSSMTRSPTLSTPWILSILGRKRQSSTTNFVAPPLEELRRRISASINGALTKQLTHPSTKLFSQETGLLWQSLDDSFDVHKVYLDVCSAFPKRLEKLLLQSGKTLDKLAGVEVVHRYHGVEAIVRDALSRGQKHGFESKDLKLADGSLGGTIFAIHNAHYSVEWIAAYLVDTDNNLFMEDVRAASLSHKERLLRIFSTYHTSDQPSWIQFGGKMANPFIYLSRLASAAEQGFLKIQSYVINLLIDDITEALKPLDINGRFKLEHYSFDTGVVSLGNPTTSSLAAHQDGKPGIVCPHTPSFSRFMLMVPTMAFQNNCGATATVSWFRSDDPKKETKATFTHDFFINHFQLMQVNDKFHHEVCMLSLIFSRQVCPYNYSLLVLPLLAIIREIHSRKDLWIGHITSTSKWSTFCQTNCRARSLSSIYVSQNF